MIPRRGQCSSTENPCYRKFMSRAKLDNAASSMKSYSDIVAYHYVKRVNKKRGIEAGDGSLKKLTKPKYLKERPYVSGQLWPC